MKYGDKVKITSGFYEGVEGTLYYEGQSNTGNNDDCYGVLIDEGEPTARTLTFRKDNLELIK